MKPHKKVVVFLKQIYLYILFLNYQNGVAYMK